MEGTGYVRRRDDDRVGLATGVRFGIEVAPFFPKSVKPRGRFGVIEAIGNGVGGEGVVDRVMQIASTQY